MRTSEQHRDARPAISAGTVLTAIVALALLGMIGAALLWPTALLRNWAGAAETAAPTFVGSDTCAGCHRTQADLWRGSQHRHAMAHATEETVRADFNDTSFDHAGVHSRFFRRGGKFLVQSER